MFQLRGPAFVELGRISGRIEAMPNSGVMDHRERQWLVHQVNGLNAVCEAFKLGTAEKLLPPTVDRLNKPTILTWATAKGEFRRLIEVIEIELDQQVFLIVHPDRIKYWRWQGSIPEAVRARFPSVVPDLMHAAVCIAVEADTAAVFHLMLVLERGMAALATALGVAHELANWHNVIDQIESRIGEMKRLPRSAEKSADQQFYSEAAKEFRYFKDAWRNYVAHARATYKAEDAVKVLQHVQDFIAHLATRLHE